MYHALNNIENNELINDTIIINSYSITFNALTNRQEGWSITHAKDDIRIA